MNVNPTITSELPTKNDLKYLLISSILISIFMTAASLVGILDNDSIYPTDELLQSFMPNDVINIGIGLPILIGSMVLTRRGKLIGLLFWPGALFFVFYNYLVYVFAMPSGWAFLLHLVLLVLSVYTMVALIAAIDAQAVKDRLHDAVPERLAGGVLTGMGALFLLRVIAVVVQAINEGVSLSEMELGLHVADFLLSPALIIGGINLWRRNALGYLTGLGLLFQASMLFIGLVIFLLIQPLITEVPFALVDVVVILVMGLICFIPTGLFVQGVLKGRSTPSS